MIEESKRLLVVDEFGKEIEMEILFTFSENSKNYVVYFDPKEESEEMTLYASVYDEEGHLYPVETDEEWNLIDEVVGSFMEDEKDGEEEVVEEKDI